ncbi:MAG: hypothetical protein METHP_01185 [Methanoregula sp. SKADARSKE-2]|nr:MAG: hypothetical protein METHP_01185 [Methanoregula sp. SKADARSKE-2]
MKPIVEKTLGDARLPACAGIIIIGLSLLLLIVCPVMAGESQGAWQISTVDDSVLHSTYSSLAFDESGAPHIAYLHNTTHSIKHAWLERGNWQTETIGPSAGTFTTSIAVGPDGNPAISYGDGIFFGNLMFANKSRGAWTNTLITRGTFGSPRPEWWAALDAIVKWGSLGDAGEWSSLAFDRSGIPHIAYNNGQVLGDLYYATRDLTSNNWKLALVDRDANATGDTGYSASLRFDSADHPHITYIGGAPWSLRYATSNDNVNWALAQVDNVGRKNYYQRTYTGASLALDSGGIPHISENSEKFPL